MLIQTFRAIVVAMLHVYSRVVVIYNPFIVVKASAATHPLLWEGEGGPDVRK